MRFELGDLLVRHGREPERARESLIAAHAEARALGLPELQAVAARQWQLVVTRFAVQTRG